MASMSVGSAKNDNIACLDCDATNLDMSGIHILIVDVEQDEPSKYI